jgi:hypothetical protein
MRTGQAWPRLAKVAGLPVSMDLSAYPKPSAVAATINTSPATETITREGRFTPVQFAIFFGKKEKKKKQTAGILHCDFIRLLFLQAHRETDRFFAVSGVQSAQSNLGTTCFHFRRAAVLNHLSQNVDSYSQRRYFTCYPQFG